jgi:hypothetical protein
LIYHNRQNVAQQFTEQRKGGRKWLNAFHFIGDKKKDQIKTPRHCCDNIEIHTKPLHTFRKINNLR